MKKRRKYSFFHLNIRLRACYLILTKRYKHWILINVTTESLYKLFTNKDFEVELLAHSVHRYVIYKMIKALASSMDREDMILLKAKFEAQMEEWKKNPGPYKID